MVGSGSNKNPPPQPEGEKLRPSSAISIDDPSETNHYQPYVEMLQAQLKVGQPVVMDLIVNDLRVEELSGVVRSASAAEDKHYYDIDFRMDGPTRANTLHCLRHIDTHVRQQLNVAG